MLLNDASVYVPLFSDICTKCVHFNQESIFGERKTCKAFPSGLPAEIWLGENDHKKPVAGDQGVQFKPLPGSDRQDAKNCSSASSSACGNTCIPSTKECRKGEQNAAKQSAGQDDWQSFQGLLREQEKNIRKGFNVKIDESTRKKGVDAVVAEVENQIRDLPYEHAVIIHPETGEVVLQKSGTQSAVYFKVDESTRMKGMIFTHNHPDMGLAVGSDTWKGSPFSFDDVRLATKYDMKEMRAVGHENSYSMKPEKAWADPQKLESTFSSSLQQATEKERIKFIRGETNAYDAQVNAHGAAWENVSKELGLTYTAKRNREAKSLRRNATISDTFRKIAVLGLLGVAIVATSGSSEPAPVSTKKRRDAKPRVCGPGTKRCGDACIPEDHECHVGTVKGRKKRKKKGLASKLLGLAGISAAGGLAGAAMSKPVLEATAKSLGFKDDDIAGLTRVGLAHAISTKALQKTRLGQKMGGHNQSWLGSTIGTLATSKNPLRDLGKTGKAYLHNAATHPGNPFGQAVKRKLSKLKFDARRSLQEAIALTTEIPIELHRFDSDRGEFTGLFSSGDLLYSFSITADDQFRCDDSDVSASHYLVGWRVDSGALRQDRGKPVCKSGGRRVRRCVPTEGSQMPDQDG